MTTKTVPYYHLEYVLKLGGGDDRDWTAHVIPIRDPGEAEEAAKFRRSMPDMYDCVRVTGPHPHEVPAS